MRLVSLAARPFPIPLLEPFAISRASVDSTRAVLVRAEASEGSARAMGFGEAALPLGASEELSDLAEAIGAASGALIGAELGDMAAISGAVDAAFSGSSAGRAGLHTALLDAFARLAGVPVHALLGSEAAAPMTTDITLPIADPRRLAELAAEYWGAGFRCFKVKVGKELARDERTLERIAAVTPEASLRLDANEGFDADAALALLRTAARVGLTVECFEQPCGRHEPAQTRRVREEGGVPVVADESLQTEADLDALLAARAVDGVNLKLVKLGGIDRALAIGRRAQASGMRLMVGAMIESRLGLTAMAHVVAALGGVEWVDLDTAFLLAEDPFIGGMCASGPELSLAEAPGLGIELGAPARWPDAR